MKLEIGQPIKVAGEKWILVDVKAECEGRQTTVHLQLTPYSKDPSLWPAPRKRWTVYIYDEDNPTDPVAEIVDEAIALIEKMKEEISELHRRRNEAASGLTNMIRDINDLDISLNRAQERLRRKVRRESPRVPRWDVPVAGVWS